MIEKDIFSDLLQKIHSNLNKIIGYRKNFKTKDDGTYVTEGDLFSQDLILNYFSKIYPESVFLAEESDLSQFKFEPSKKYIVVDPIDGTSNFKSGLKEWGVGVSIFNGNKHQQSIIILPELNQYLKTGMKIEKFNSRILVLPSSIRANQIKEEYFKFEMRMSGSCMFNMYNTVLGSFHTFENIIGAYNWDVLPGLNLALEHNLKVTVNDEAYTGDFLYPNIKYRFKVTNALS